MDAEARKKLRRAKTLTNALSAAADKVEAAASERRELWRQLRDHHGVQVRDIAAECGVTTMAIHKSLGKAS